MIKINFKNIKKTLSWVLFISNRFAKVDNSGRSAATGFMASLGIAFGVLSLIVIISVMNGFQMEYIDSIMEISSFHIRAVPESQIDANEALKIMQREQGVKSAIPMYEAQTLLIGKNNRQRPGLIRGIPDNIMNTDVGFKREVHVVDGEFSLSEVGTVVLGNDLARRLSVHVGDKVNLLALSGGSSSALFAENRELIVTGVFVCGYSDINGSYAFISLDSAKSLLGDEVVPFYSIKLINENNDGQVISVLEKKIPGINFESWRSYNRAFFGALRVEKNTLMILVFLIFVVVSVNIYNSMRKMVFERHEEIAVLSALGVKKNQIKLIFNLQGFVTGLKGAIPGLILGLLICVQMEQIIQFFYKVTVGVQNFINLLLSTNSSIRLSNTSAYLYYAKIPARIIFSEVAAITVFGVLAAFTATWFASRKVVGQSIAEVLKDE